MFQFTHNQQVIPNIPKSRKGELTTLHAMGHFFLCSIALLKMSTDKDCAQSDTTGFWLLAGGREKCDFQYKIVLFELKKIKIK